MTGKNAFLTSLVIALLMNAAALKAEDYVEMEEVVVTATKMEIAEEDLPTNERREPFFSRALPGPPLDLWRHSSPPLSEDLREFLHKLWLLLGEIFRLADVGFEIVKFDAAPIGEEFPLAPPDRPFLTPVRPEPGP